LAYHLTLSTFPTHRAALIEEALLLSGQANDDLGLAHCYWLLGELASQQIDFVRALEYFQRALDLFQALNCLLFVKICRLDLANVWLQLGNVEKAIPILEQGIGGETGDEGYLFEVGLVCHAFMYLLRKDERQGRRLFEQELARQRLLGAPEMLAPLLHAYGRQLALSDAPQDVDRGFQMLTECLALWRQLGIKWSRAGGTARAYMDLGHIYTRRGDYALALAYEQEASRLYHEAGDLHGVAWAQMSIGWPALAQGDLALAQASFQNSLHFTPDGSMDNLPYALIGLAETRRRQGKLARSAQLFGASARFNERDTAEYAPLKHFSALQAAHAHLSNPDFAAAWAEGEAMTIEQAIALALES
jgi:tetratricopeptide (TPR) repeat protein